MRKDKIARLKFSYRTVAIMGVAVVTTGAAAALLEPAGQSDAAFTSSLRASETQLATIDRTFQQVERATATGAATDAAAGQLEMQQADYVKGMNARYSEALGQVQLIVTSKGKAGSVAGLKAFEDLAQVHEARLKILAGRARAFAPQGTQRIAPPAYVAQREAAWSPIDLIIPRARAAIALTVYNACKQPRNDAACVAAIAKAKTDVQTANQNFNSCWASYENTRPKKVRAILRIVCTATLVGRLA